VKRIHNGMNVLHFILGKASKERANGVNQVVAGLAKYTSRNGVNVRVIGKTHSVAADGEVLPRDGFSAEVFPAWAQPLRAALSEAIYWADVVHLHGGYSPWNILVGRMCQRIGRPYIVTLHNVLSPELARAHGRVKKFFFHTLLQRRHLEAAAALHVLTEEEGSDVFARVKPASVYCIPNGVDLEDYPSTALHSVKPSDSYLRIGYLGRLSEEKNLDALCAAVAKVRNTHDIRLKLAGPESSYGRSLQSRYGADSVELVGPVFGDEKTAFMRSLDILAIPSLSEGFSVAAAEALALKTPLLITRTSKLSHFYDQSPFFMCEATRFGIERGILRAISNRREWAQRTQNGRRLVETELNWNSIASEMIRVYANVLGVGR
jgi:glycosyltransferase involved in cell wall biosynthesis